MGVEVTVKFKCDGCGKTIEAPAKATTDRRRNYYNVPGAFIVTDDLRDTDAGGLAIDRNVSDIAIKETQGDKDSHVACSPRCVVTLVTKCMEKVK